jgi:hypothetical protein
MFEYTKTPRDITAYTMIRGTTDFGNLKQWNQYESGYGFLVVVGVPKFLEVLAQNGGEQYATLLSNYKHILEYEFKGIDGLENMTVDKGTITDGISNLEIITKVNMQSASTFTMRYNEKSGTVLTKMHELFLSGIKDPRTQVKHYHGMIKAGLIEPGYENEIFTLLYFNTDNTMRDIERAVLILAGQPTTAELSIHNMEKGDIQFKEVGVEMSGFPVTGNEVNRRAKELLTWMTSDSNPNRIIIDSADFNYTGINTIKTK